MDLLADRKADDSPIFRAHMERTLKEHARKMDEKQSAGYSVFKDPSFSGRSYSTDGDSLTYTQSALYRFVDMKKLRYPGTQTQYKRKKVYDFHNRIIMGHYNGIMKDLIYGAAAEVEADLRSKIDNTNI
ncbi:hypothetical protein L0B70_00460 [Kaistella sp. 97-N-M2]|uniref:hypothetical protein n=1 Tax=Kaistella sp. 97-N-M2 TaxID=2908645 RepID=UPI001F390E1B|nr:hypothetical protein [Kaistella sp. 97-N-M2]UJF29900.1 hypothetical protein L0B70_00460 [Kaistella sp. 97-N-M2]